jgi:hypothetical protein
MMRLWVASSICVLSWITQVRSEGRAFLFSMVCRLSMGQSRSFPVSPDVRWTRKARLSSRSFLKDAPLFALYDAGATWHRAFSIWEGPGSLFPIELVGLEERSNPSIVILICVVPALLIQALLGRCAGTCLPLSPGCRKQKRKKKKKKKKKN